MGSPTRRSAQGFPVPLGDAIEDAISLSTLTNIIMMLNPAGEVVVLGRVPRRGGPRSGAGSPVHAFGPLGPYAGRVAKRPDSISSGGARDSRDSGRQWLYHARVGDAAASDGTPLGRRELLDPS